MIAIAMLLALSAANALSVGFDGATSIHSTSRALSTDSDVGSMPPSLPPPSSPPVLLSPPAAPPMDIVYHIGQFASVLRGLAELVQEVSASIRGMLQQLHGYLGTFLNMLKTMDLLLGPVSFIKLAPEVPSAPPMMPRPAAPPLSPPSPPQLPPSPPSRPKRDLTEILDVYLYSVVPALQSIYLQVFGQVWADAGRWAHAVLNVYLEVEEVYTAYEEQIIPALHDLEESIRLEYNSTVHGSLGDLTDAVDLLEQAVRDLHAD